MFVRVDKDFFVNIDKISSYLLKEEEDAIRLIIYVDGKVSHNIVYLKCDNEAINILSNFIEATRSITYNPEYSIDQLLKIQESKKDSEEDIDRAEVIDNG